MKTSQSFRIYFTIKSDKEKEGKAPLYVVITINKEKCFIALKQKMVETRIWDFGKGALKGTKDETKELNAYLDEVRLKLGNCYKELQLKGKLITTTAVKNLFLGEKEEVYTLSRLVSYHNETSTTNLKWMLLQKSNRVKLKFTFKIGEVLSSSVIGSGGGWAGAKTEEDLYLLDPSNGATMMDIPFGHTLAAFVDVLGDFKTVNAILARRRTEVLLYSTGKTVPQLANDQIVLAGNVVANLHYRSGMSAGTNFLWEINGTKGDIVISAGLGHYQLAPILIQFAASGQKLQKLEVPDEFLAEGLSGPEQPVRGLYYAYKAILADIKNDTQLVPDFGMGVRVHKLLAVIVNAASEKHTIVL